MARRPLLRICAPLAAALMLAACSGSGKSPFALAPHAPTTTSAAPGSTSTALPASPIQWTPCRGSAGPSGFQCATIQVPRDPTHPSAAGTIQMAVDRRPASGQKIGSLLVDPGGPGASGVDFLSQMAAELDPSVLQSFDIVGFDPPGVDRTAPIICLDGPGLDQYFAANPVPTTPQQLSAFIALDQKFAAGCEAHSGAELPYVSTVDAAMDMDILRADLGDSKLTYLGFSYGTFLGATYANLFPSHVRALVLDGALDPSLAVIPSLDRQAAGFDADLKDALGACAASPSCPWKPSGDPVAAYQQMLARVGTNPLPEPGSSRTVSTATFLSGTAVTLYDTTDWKYLWEALAQAENGDGSLFQRLADLYADRNSNGTYGNLLEAFTAVTCLDQPAPSIAQIQAAAPAAQQMAPIFGLSNLYSEIQCDEWPVPATGHIGPIQAAGSPPIVVVGSTGDPATPYSDAQALASQLQHGVLLTRVGDGHTAYTNSSCIRRYVDAYLIDLTVPPAGVRCNSD